MSCNLSWVSRGTLDLVLKLKFMALLRHSVTPLIGNFQLILSFMLTYISQKN